MCLNVIEVFGCFFTERSSDEDIFIIVPDSVGCLDVGGIFMLKDVKYFFRLNIVSVNRLMTF